jgi:nucleoside-diphosphate-sugar epimerase
MVPSFVAQALSGADLAVTGGGSQRRSICLVSDTVAGLPALAGVGYPQPVNIGSPDELTVAELAHRVRDLTGTGSSIRYVPREAEDPSRRCPDLAQPRESPAGHRAWESRRDSRGPSRPRVAGATPAAWRPGRFRARPQARRACEWRRQE